MWEQILAIFIVLGLLILSLWLLRRKGFTRVKLGLGNSGGSTRRMELIERMPLTPQHSLHLVRIDDGFVLIGISPTGCASLNSFSSGSNASSSLSGKARLNS